MKELIVITGASSGMGMEFARALAKTESDCEFLFIARRGERLKKLGEKLNVDFRALSLDLTKEESFAVYENLLKEENPNVRLLINCSGYGKFLPVCETEKKDIDGMTELNCKALAKLSYLTVPHMKNGSAIINLCSIAAFQPVPYLNIYAASKAFVLSFSRALNVELKPRGIRALAVCPGWVATEFFERAVEKGNAYVSYYDKIYSPEFIVDTALKTLRNTKKDFVVPGFRAGVQVFLVKHLPHRLVMKIWLRQQGLNKRGNHNDNDNSNDNNDNDNSDNSDNI